MVIDMSDDIYCKQSAERIAVLAPRMNAVLSAAQAHGVQIVHAPSGTVDVYADTPFRKRVQQAKPAKPPFDASGSAMYDPREKPFVSHARGTELIVEHIERQWCPSILGEDPTKVVRGSAGHG